MTWTRRQVTAGASTLVLSAMLDGPSGAQTPQPGGTAMTADVILVNGRFATLDPANPDPQAVAITAGKFSGVGTEAEMRALRPAGGSRRGGRLAPLRRKPLRHRADHLGGRRLGRERRTGLIGGLRFSVFTFSLSVFSFQSRSGKAVDGTGRPAAQLKAEN